MAYPGGSGPTSPAGAADPSLLPVPPVVPPVPLGGTPDVAAGRQRSSSPGHALRGSGVSTPISRGYGAPRALSGTRPYTASQQVSARASYESAILTAVRKQLEAFEEKVNNQITRAQAHEARMREATFQRLEDKLSAAEGLGPKSDRKMAELTGTCKGLSDEMQQQIRRIDAFEERLREWRRTVEEEFRQRHGELETQVQKAASDTRMHGTALEEDKKRQHARLTRLESQHQDHTVSHDYTKEGMMHLHARVEALEAADAHREAALSPASHLNVNVLARESAPAASAPSSDHADMLKLFETRLADHQEKTDKIVDDSHDIHARLEAQEERLRSMRTLMDAREEHWKAIGERLERHDWDGRLEQMRQQQQEESRHRLEHHEKLQLVVRKLEDAEQAHEDLRNSHQELLRAGVAHGAGGPADAGMQGELEDVDVRFQELSVRLDVLEAEVHGVKSDSQHVTALVTKLQDLTPHIFENAAEIKRLRDEGQSRPAQASAEDLNKLHSTIGDLHARLDADAGARGERLDLLVGQLQEIVPKVVAQEEFIQEHSVNLSGLVALMGRVGDVENEVGVIGKRLEPIIGLLQALKENGNEDMVKRLDEMDRGTSDKLDSMAAKHAEHEDLLKRLQEVLDSRETSSSLTKEELEQRLAEHAEQARQLRQEAENGHSERGALLAELRSEFASHRDDMFSKLAELAELRGEFTSHKESTAGRLADLADLRGELTSHKESTAGQLADLADLRGEFTSHKESTAGRLADLADLRGELTSHKESTAGQLADLAELHGKFSSHEAQMAQRFGDLERDVNDAKSNADARSGGDAALQEAHSERLRELERQLGESRAQYEAHEASVTQRFSDFDGRLGEHSRDFGERHRELTERLHDRHEQLQRTVDEHKAALAERGAGGEDAEAAALAREALEQRLTARHDDMQRKNDELVAQLSELRDKHGELHNKHGELRDALDSKQKSEESAANSEAQAEMEKHVAALRSDLHELRALERVSTGDVTEIAQPLVTQLRDELHQVIKVVKDEVAVVADQAAQLDAASSDRAELRKDVTALQSSVRELEEALEQRLTARHEDMQRKNDELVAQFTELRDKHGELRDALDAKKSGEESAANGQAHAEMEKHLEAFRSDLHELKALERVSTGDVTDIAQPLVATLRDEIHQVIKVVKDEVAVLADQAAQLDAASSDRAELRKEVAALQSAVRELEQRPAAAAAGGGEASATLAELARAVRKDEEEESVAHEKLVDRVSELIEQLAVVSDKVRANPTGGPDMAQFESLVSRVDALAKLESRD
eukprot:TRINITY_DN1801_c1_g1_i2.p1 TRINITY_DN1801_c1_g1~~TRINITY_DN1801_c1_g1_i2.p1  ORF type:complete len:1329 (+),score=419.28 TRINITY_DN1801_c1_g1_i2:109-3987(+)